MVWKGKVQRQGCAESNYNGDLAYEWEEFVTKNGQMCKVTVHVSAQRSPSSKLGASSFIAL